ncbi:MAG TPA: hypothetical protein VGN37_11565 [Actinocatenispora sp.]
MVRWLTLLSLRIAVRRLPSALRTEMRAEWSAELHAITARPGSAARGLAFAASLAATRPGAWQSPSTIGAQMSTMLKSGWKPTVLWLLAGPVLATAVFALLTAARALPSDGEQFTGLVQVALLAAIVGGLVPVGRAAARPGMVPGRAPVVWAVVLVAAGAIAADLVWPVVGLGDTPVAYAHGLVTLLVALAFWAAVVLATERWMGALVRRGRPVLATLVAVVGTMVAVNLALVAPAWLIPSVEAWGYNYPPMERTFFELPLLDATFEQNVPQAHLILAMSPYLLVALAVPVLAYRWRIAQGVPAGVPGPALDGATAQLQT